MMLGHLMVEVGERGYRISMFYRDAGILFWILSAAAFFTRFILPCVPKSSGSSSTCRPYKDQTDKPRVSYADLSQNFPRLR